MENQRTDYVIIKELRKNFIKLFFITIIFFLFNNLSISQVVRYKDFNGNKIEFWAFKGAENNSVYWTGILYINDESAGTYHYDMYNENRYEGSGSLAGCYIYGIIGNQSLIFVDRDGLQYTFVKDNKKKRKNK